MPRKKAIRKKQSPTSRVSNVHGRVKDNFITNDEAKELATAIQQGDLETVRKFCDNKTPTVITQQKIFIAIDGEGKSNKIRVSPLAYAVFSQQTAIVSLLAENSAKDIFNKKEIFFDEEYMTLLQFVCLVFDDTKEMIEIFLNNGANVNEIISLEKTQKFNKAPLLFYCVLYQYEELANQIISHEDFNKNLICTMEDGSAYTMLLYLIHFCVQSRDNQLAQRMLMKLLIMKPDFSPVGKYFAFPERIAIEEKSLKFLKLLKVYGGDFSKKINVPIEKKKIKAMSLLEYTLAYYVNDYSVVNDIIGYLVSLPDFVNLKSSIYFSNNKVKGYFSADLLTMLCFYGCSKEILDKVKIHKVNPFYRVKATIEKYMVEKNLEDNFLLCHIKNPAETAFKKTKFFQKNEISEEKIIRNHHFAKINEEIFSPYGILIERENLEDISHFFDYMKEYNKQSNNKACDWQFILQESFYILVTKSDYKQEKDEQSIKHNKNLNAIFYFLIEQGLDFRVIYEDLKGHFGFDPIAALMSRFWPKNIIEKVIFDYHCPYPNITDELNYVTPLNLAVSYKDNTYLSWLLEKNMLNDCSSFEIESVLSSLCMRGNLKFFKQIIQHLHTIKEKQISLSSVFLDSVLFENAGLSFIEALLDSGYLPTNAEIEECIAFNKYAVVEFLQGKGLLNLEALCSHGKFQGQPLFMKGFLDESGEKIKWMLDLGLDLSKKYKGIDGKATISVWQFALAIKNDNILCVLLKHAGGSKKLLSEVKKGLSPLSAAIVEGNEKLVSMLLAEGVDVNRKEKKTIYKNKTPMEIACSLDNKALVNLIEKTKHNKHSITDAINLSQYIIADKVPTYHFINTLKDDDINKTKCLLKLVNAYVKKLSVNQLDIDSACMYLVEILNTMHFLSQNNTVVAGINFRPALNILLHRYNQLNSSAIMNHLVKKIIIPLLNKLTQSQPIQVQTVNQQLKHWCSTCIDKSVKNEASDSIKTLDELFKKLANLYKKIETADILYVNDDLLATLKWTIVCIGDWVQKNNKILIKDELDFEKDFLAVCKLMRDYTSHEQLNVETILEKIHPYIFFDVMKYGERINIESSYLKNKAIFQAVLNEPLHGNATCSM